MLIVTGTITVAPADLSSFCDDVGALAAATRRRDGNITYDVAVLDEAAGRLLVAERWRDAAALAAHLAADDTATFVARWQARMTAEVRQYDAANERALGGNVSVAMNLGNDVIRFLDAPADASPTTTPAVRGGWCLRFPAWMTPRRVPPSDAAPRSGRLLRTAVYRPSSWADRCPRFGRVAIATRCANERQPTADARSKPAIPLSTRIVRQRSPKSEPKVGIGARPLTKPMKIN